MSQRGISTIIASILMLIIVIALGGTAWVFFSGILTGRTAQTFEIIDTIGSSITIKNSGTVNIDNIAATLDGQSVNIKVIPTVIPPGEIADIIILAQSISRGTHKLGLCTRSMCSPAYITITVPGTGKSCLNILERGGSIGDGIYTIKPGTNVVQVYCDMSTNEGGWTLAAVCQDTDPSCWNANAIGGITDPNSPTSIKLSDSDIKAVLNSGEKITRTYWRQEYRLDTYNPRTAAIFNRISNPDAWSSSGCGAQGKEFYSKYAYENSIDADIIPISEQAYASSWGSVIYSESTTCSCAVNGWSNVQKDSCGFATWYAGCEGGPSMSHCCACTLYLERADIIVWIR